MITVREMKPQDSQADFDRLLPSYLRLWNHPENLPFLVYSMKPLSVKQIRFEFLHHLLIGVRYFVAMLDEDIVGMSIVKCSPVEGFELAGIALLPEFKRRGIGRQLVEQAAIIARWEGFNTMRATVFSDNKRMINLLMRQGFRLDDVSENARSDGADLLRFCRWFG